MVSQLLLMCASVCVRQTVHDGISTVAHVCVCVRQTVHDGISTVAHVCVCVRQTVHDGISTLAHVCVCVRQTVHDGISTLAHFFTSSHSSSLLQVLLKSVNPDGSSTKLTEMAMKVPFSPPISLSVISHTHCYIQTHCRVYSSLSPSSLSAPILNHSASGR